ncbi:PurK Phosphoribosylaminoimidazole carboxylase (NCAIR synthetase) [Candidatus Nanopelagicaceae bacterium]
MALKLTLGMLFIYDSEVKERFPTVGIIGAGQLARMSVAPAIALGINLLLFAQDEQDCAAQIAPHVVGDYRDLAQLLEFAKQCDLVTFEHELVPLSVIKGLEAAGIKVFPTSNSFQYSQDKAAMRAKLATYPSPKWRVIEDEGQAFSFPFMAKKISGGYDGQGVWKVKNLDDLEELLLEHPQLLIEELIEFDIEIAVMVARSEHGQATSWAPTQTVQEDGICTLTITPAPTISTEIAEKAQHLALSIASDISLIGVMAVEMFIKGDEIFINELAMRPHNSGHWTIEGSRTSQFEQHLRAILDLPLGDPTMTAPYAVMGNNLGGDKTDMYRPYLHLMARNPELKFHQYKKEVRKGRKIGHVTVIGENLLELTEVVEHARDYMSGEIDE